MVLFYFVFILSFCYFAILCYILFYSAMLFYLVGILQFLLIFPQFPAILFYFSSISKLFIVKCTLFNYVSGSFYAPILLSSISLHSDSSLVYIYNIISQVILSILEFQISAQSTMLTSSSVGTTMRKLLKDTLAI